MVAPESHLTESALHLHWLWRRFCSSVLLVGSAHGASCWPQALHQFGAEAEGDLALEVGQVIVLTKAKASKAWWAISVGSAPAPHAQTARGRCNRLGRVAWAECCQLGGALSVGRGAVSWAGRCQLGGALSVG
jgi:hypothetical protein